LILLAYLDILNSRTTDTIKELIKEISKNKESTGKRLHELLFLLIEFDEITDIQDFSFVLEYIENNYIDSIDIEKLLKLIKKFKIKDESFIEKFSIAVDSFIRDELNDNKGSVDFGKHIRFSNYMEQEEMDVDYEGINSELESILESIVSMFDEDLLKYTYIDQSDILASINIEQEIESYANSFGDYYEDEFRGRTSSYIDSENDIDNIFERT
jgi:hypothetical protein